MGRLFSRRKGLSIGDLAPIAVVLLMAGIVISIGAEITTDVGDSSVRESLSIVNESVALSVFGTNYTLSRYGGGDGFSITKIANATTVIGLGNTTSNALGELTLYARAPLNVSAGTYNVTYSYDRYLDAWWASMNATEGSNKLAKWMPTIGMVVAAAIIIGLIFRSFVTKTQE